MKELTREDVPPGTWLIYKGRAREEYLTVGDRYQVSNCKVYNGDIGEYVNVLGSKYHNSDGGFNVPMKDFTLVEATIVNNYQIY